MSICARDIFCSHCIDMSMVVTIATLNTGATIKYMYIHITHIVLFIIEPLLFHAYKYTFFCVFFFLFNSHLFNLPIFINIFSFYCWYYVMSHGLTDVSDKCRQNWKKNICRKIDSATFVLKNIKRSQLAEWHECRVAHRTFEYVRLVEGKK